MWIEIRETLVEKPIVIVTPRAGVWIEIRFLIQPTLVIVVTPRAGVWIEIKNEELSSILSGHSPCGSVD